MNSSERRAETPKEVLLAELRRKYDLGGGLTIKEIAQYTQLSAQLAIDDVNRHFDTALKDLGEGLARSSKDAARKVGHLIPDLSREQKRMLTRLTDLQALHLSDPDNFSLEESAELKVLEMALATSESFANVINSSSNSLVHFVENLLPTRRMKRLSPLLSLTTMGGLLIAACTGGSAFGAPRLTDTAGSPRTSTPRPSASPTSTERPATVTPIEVDPTETAFPTITKTPRPTRTPRPTATETATPTPEAEVDIVDLKQRVDDFLAAKGEYTDESMKPYLLMGEGKPELGVLSKFDWWTFSQGVLLEQVRDEDCLHLLIGTKDGVGKRVVIVVDLFVAYGGKEDTDLLLNVTEHDSNKIPRNNEATRSFGSSQEIIDFLSLQENKPITLLTLNGFGSFLDSEPSQQKPLVEATSEDAVRDFLNRAKDREALGNSLSTNLYQTDSDASANGVGFEGVSFYNSSDLIEGVKNSANLKGPLVWAVVVRTQ